jgi:16S rRNA (uracil1498-N3)-methyltransferase
MIVFYCPELQKGDCLLTDDEHRHCSLVLRKKAGDTIYVIDGKGNAATGTIISSNKKQTNFTVEQIDSVERAGSKLAIAIAPTKNISRIEWFLEKATEIGIDEFFPVIYDHSERKNIKPERLEKIILSATKQSLRKYKPILHPLSKLTPLLSDNNISSYNCTVAHYKEAQSSLTSFLESSSDQLVFIGPEGDFSPAELAQFSEQGFPTANLSKNRLRTETAGLIAAMQLVQG